MNAQSLIEQLLKSGLSAMDGTSAKVEQAGVSADWSQYATGAAAGGVLGLLLGSRRGRSLGGKALKIGSVAALGTLAWRAWQAHQARQGVASAGPAATPTPAGAEPAMHALPAPQAEERGRALLKAMIAAAKSDGHMDERERTLVEAELHRAEADPALRTWVEAELRRPLDPADVAASVTGPEMAAEIYLSSLIVVDETTPMERAYLDALAQALHLPPDLKADLEARMAAA
jgi:uncharacterized membrane protein YebE (DUF533 family)